MKIFKLNFLIFILIGCLGCSLFTKKSSSSSSREPKPLENGSLELLNDIELSVNLIYTILEEVVFLSAMNPDTKLDDDILENELYQISKYNVHRDCKKNDELKPVINITRNISLTETKIINDTNEKIVVQMGADDNYEQIWSKENTELFCINDENNKLFNYIDLTNFDSAHIETKHISSKTKTIEHVNIQNNKLLAKTELSYSFQDVQNTILVHNDIVQQKNILLYQVNTNIKSAEVRGYDKNNNYRSFTFQLQTTTPLIIELVRNKDNLNNWLLRTVNSGEILTQNSDGSALSLQFVYLTFNASVPFVCVPSSGGIVVRLYNPNGQEGKNIKISFDDKFLNAQFETESAIAKRFLNGCDLESWLQIGI